MTVQLYLGDCLSVMAELPENSVDTIITDPPYGLTFMGKDWDRGVPGVAFWEQALRVAKPGAMLLAMGGTRTFHRLVCAIEDAGWEVRDSMAWLYGSGFPKSYDISKGIEARVTTGMSSPKAQRMTAMGEDYQTTPLAGTPNYGVTGNFTNKDTGSKPMKIQSQPAQLWHGWGTALKPAMELICVAMKPIDGNFVNNALTWGVAGLWIDGGRVGTDEINLHGNGGNVFGGGKSETNYHTVTGRFPANVIHDGSDEVTGLFPMTGISRGGKTGGGFAFGKEHQATSKDDPGYGDSGSAARFFMSCKQDDLCFLCLTPKHSIMSDIDNSEVIRCKNISANNVEKSLTTTQATALNTAQESVQDLLLEKAVHFVKSAGNLCEECATSIVREVVEIKTWDSKNAASQVIQDFIGNSNKCILIQSLAQYAEIWDSIDTTPTTTSLLKLFGYASHVITSYIQETEKTAPKRFLYTPKASRSERNAGLEGMEERKVNKLNSYGSQDGYVCSDGAHRVGDKGSASMQNHHPTVKPLALMRYLARLTKTPTGGVVLDPFMGSGTTGMAAVLEGRDFVGIELNAEYLEIAEKRIAHAQMQPRLVEAQKLG